MNQNKDTELLLNTLKVSTSPFHAVKEAKSQLDAAGYVKLEAESAWSLEVNQGYYIDIFGTTLIGFRANDDFLKRPGCRIAAAHTDWPCLRVKPSPEVTSGKYGKVNVEVYGGPIYSTWLDRPLSLSGRITVASPDTPWKPKSQLVDFDRTLLTIPNLAIHMNREVNKGVELNPQTDLLPLLTMIEDSLNQEHYFLDLLAEEAGIAKDSILDYEMYIYNREQAELWGLNREFLSGPRLDNITSVQACLSGLLDSSRTDGLDMIVLFDNEEIGSRTKQGADSMMLANILELIYLAFGLDRQTFLTAMLQSFLLSIDVAHATHPNKPEKSDITNRVYLNDGFAIKMSSRQAYSTDSSAIAVIEGIAAKYNIPYKKYANRSDILGGGTLGTIVSAQLAVKAIDVGVPLLAMHSSWETMGAADQKALTDLVRGFFSS